MLYLNFNKTRFSICCTDMLIKDNQKSKTLLQWMKEYYWLQMSNSVKQLSQKCPQCILHQKSLPAETLLHTKATYPFEKVSCDIATVKSKDFLIINCNYSGYIFACQIRDKFSATVIKQLHNVFLTQGFPRFFISDGASCFSSDEFKNYCSSNGIYNDLSSPHKPSSNSKAEVHIGIFKNLYLKNDCDWTKFRHSLLHFHNISKTQGYSPSELYYNRTQRTGRPLHHSHYAFREVMDRGLPPKMSQTKRTHLPLQVNDICLLQNAKTLKWDVQCHIMQVRA